VPPIKSKGAAVLASLVNQVRRADRSQGAALLMSFDRPTAAGVIAGCPQADQVGLLHELAALDLTVAAAIVPMLLAEVAGRAFAELRHKTAAALLDAMPPAEAARILGSTETRAAASAILELAPPRASARLKALPDVPRAARILSAAPTHAAVAIAAADREFARRILPHLTDPLRTDISRAMADSSG
jgi:Mg/Co/Ni transporter MgtE